MFTYGWPFAFDWKHDPGPLSGRRPTVRLHFGPGIHMEVQPSNVVIYRSVIGGLLETKKFCQKVNIRIDWQVFDELTTGV